MILLDTDHVTLLQFGGSPAETIEQRLRLAGQSVPGTTIVSYEEHVRGWLGKISSADSLAAEVRFYAKLKAQLLFYQRLVVVDFTEAAATELQQLRKQKLRVGTMDLKIAAVALANNATLCPATCAISPASPTSKSSTPPSPHKKSPALPAQGLHPCPSVVIRG
jgi:tRNA(fMet)-specific endonuclease VapC